jgi:hypothetical protein
MILFLLSISDGVKMRLLKILFLLFFLSSTAYAADPEGLVSYPPEKIMGFRGLDTRSTAPTLADGRALDLNNVKLSAAFNLTQRNGYSVINDTLDDLNIDSPAITGLFDTEYSDGNAWLLAFVGDSLKYDNSGTWTTLIDYASAETITTGQNNQWACTLALDNAICTNDVDLPLKIDSTPDATLLDVSDLTDTLTKAKAIAWYRNFLILGNTVENSVERPTRFRYSNVGTIATWSDDDFVDISTFGGDEIIGFAELYGELFIFLKKSIWRASFVGGDDVFVFRKAIEGFGAVARDSIEVVVYPDGRNEVIFLNEEKKLFSFNGIVVSNIGLIIQPTLDNLNEVRLQYAQGISDGKSYFLSVSTGSSSTNDTLYEFELETREWTKHDQIDANALARVKATSNVRTYFGNYKSFVYWLDNPDNKNDVDGDTGIIDSVSTTSTDTMTGAQAILMSNLATGTYTGAIIKITSGTGAGEEAVVVTNLKADTGLAVATAFSTTPDSTSVYSIGAIEASYTGKWYDLGNSAKEKTFLGMLLWGKEQSESAIDVSRAIDFGSTRGSTTKSLSPSSTSLWDSAVWDTSTWGTTGDKIYTFKFKGFGNFIQPKFENDNIDSTFNLYGFNLLGTVQDVKQ